MSAITGTLESFKVVDTTDPEHFFNAALSFRPHLRGFSPIAAELIQGGYDKWVSVEVFDTTISPDILAAVSMKNLRAAFPSD